MAKYCVSLPFTGVAYVTVEADNPKDAKDAAFNVDFSIKAESKSELEVSIEDFDVHEQICNGKVFYGCQNGIEVTTMDD